MRRRMSKRASRRLFTNTARRTHKYNTSMRIPRGGRRL